MIRYLLSAAGGSFALLVFAISQVCLYTSLFDYRFGFVALGASALGLAIGLAIGNRSMDRPEHEDGAIWMAASGLAAAVSTGLPLVVSFGTIGAFFLVVVASAMPFVSWLAGLAILQRSHKVFPQQLIWASIAGAVIGVVVSQWLPDLVGGPLAMAGLAAVVLALLAAVIHHRVFVAAVSGVTFSVLGLAWIYSSGDFSPLPHWESKDTQYSKPLYMEPASSPVIRLGTRWDGFSRTDVVSHQAASSDLLWTYTNGTFSGLVPAVRPGPEASEWLRKNFPLLDLSLQIGQPQKILVLNSGVGPEFQMAAAAGVPEIDSLETNCAARRIVDQRRSDHRSQPSQSTTGVVCGDVRGTLRGSTSLYDQIYLPITQKQASGWTESGLSESYLYTKEAFRDYWAHLKPGGMLVILAGEEKFYIRSMLMAWETLVTNRIDGNGSLIRHAWGFHMSGLTSPDARYEYLLVLVKGPIAEGLDARVKELTKGFPVTSLFGPGVVLSTSFDVRRQPYNILYHPLGLDVARAALNQAMAWHLHAPADLASATDQRPFFFQIAQDIPPLFKGLLIASLMSLACVFLFPLSATRRLDHPASGERPPLPVYLSYFIFLGVGLTLATTAFMHQSALLTGYSGLALTAVVCAMLFGAGVGIFVHQRDLLADFQYRWQGTAIMMAALCGLSYAFLDYILETAGNWNLIARAVIVFCMVFPTGVLSMALLMDGLDHLRWNITALVPWAWVTWGITILGSVVAALWIAQLWGWSFAWLIAAGCFAAMAGLGFWFRWVANQGQFKAVPARG